MFRFHAGVAIGVIVLGAASTPAHAQYRFKTVAGPKGGSQIYESVNSVASILSEVTSAAGVSSCTLMQGGSTTAITDPNGSYTQCYGLDNDGEVVGFYVPASDANTLEGFTFKAGTYSDFTAEGSVAAEGGTQLDAISSNGKIIAGTYANSSGYSIAFTVARHRQKDISIPGADYLVATGVNNAGDVTIQSFDVNNNILANYLVSGSTVTQIAYPGMPKTTVHGINDDGVVVGNFTNTSGVEEGFTYTVSSGTYSAAIDDAKVADTILIGVNDKGLIVGGAITNGGVLVGLVATPKR